jgi:hypothetical protein
MLDMSSCWELTDAAVEALGQLCPRLRCLDLSNCKKIQDIGLAQLLAPLCELQELKLAYCKALTDAALQAIFVHARRLRALNLQRCTGITDGGWRALRVPDHVMNELVALVLADCSFLTNDAVLSVATGCPALQYLNLSFCCAITPVAVELLVQGCPKVHTRPQHSRAGAARRTPVRGQLTQGMIHTHTHTHIGKKKTARGA